MEEVPDLNPSEKPKQPKIIDEAIEAAKETSKENIEHTEYLLKANFDLLRSNIELLKQSEDWIKEMIKSSKENKEMDDFFKSQGKESSYGDHSYTVGDVEKEMHSIEEIKSQIQELRQMIGDAHLELVKEQEELKHLEDMEKEFREIATRINPGQFN